MPTVEVSRKDLARLTGRKWKRSELEEALMYVKGELDEVADDVLKIDVKDTNRPDLWSTEGIARELRARTGKEKGIPRYPLKKSKVELHIDKSVEGVRPLIKGAVVRDVKVTEDLLVQMIQLQEKVGMTFGRRRREIGAGWYDLDKMTPPIFYRAFLPPTVKFVPLDFEDEMDLDDILEQHPKGKEYGHLLAGASKYPIVIDSEDVVCSMPPIINSAHTGRVTTETSNLFLEVTGFREDLTTIALDVLASALAERGGCIEQVKIVPARGKPFWTPHFTPHEGKVKISEINRRSGFAWKKVEIKKLLEHARYDVRMGAQTVAVRYPSYRGDILHPVDVIEDLLIGYGYNNIEPLPIEMAVIGEEREETRLQDEAREACIGIGLQEVLTFTMTSIEKQQDKMGWKNAEFVEIANPVSANWQVMRRSLIPELLEFLANNKDARYPHRIFEVGKCVIPHLEQETKVEEPIKLCVAFSDANTGFTEIKSALNEVAQYRGVDVKITRVKDPALTEGRAAKVIVNGKPGILGEVNDHVRSAFGLENPVAVFEIEL